MSIRCALLLLASCFLLPAETQTVKSIPIGTDFKGQSQQTLGFLPDNDAAYECANPPSVNDLRNASFTTSLTVLSAEQAAKLKITFSGSAGGQVDRSQQVVVSQAGRMKDCLAKDGKTRLLYGHVVRTTVLLSNYAVSGDVSLAIVAAQATIKGASNRVELEAVGVPDIEVQKKLQEAKQTLGGRSLIVENFADFDKKRGEAENMAVASDKVGSTRIAILGEPVSVQSIQGSLARIFALQNMTQSRDCQQAVADFKLKTTDTEAVLRSTYDQIAGGCSVDGVAKERAKQLLGSFELRQR